MEKKVKRIDNSSNEIASGEIFLTKIRHNHPKTWARRSPTMQSFLGKQAGSRNSCQASAGVDGTKTKK